MSKKLIKKIRQEIIQNIIHNKKQKETERNRMKQKDQVTPKLQRSMVSFSSYQSRFLEAPLVQQADSELKKWI